MIKITIELVPHGIGEPRHLGILVICNTGEGSKTRGDYNYRISNKAGSSWRNGSIENFPRKRLLVWDLLYCILRKEFGERNEE